ncbi:hypothetical protein HZF08_01825 [Paenibacillus sp. CGMCC 1.16610]|uniref:Uncharacterized protein n=1 Tax=Paenibacillus anseongense TaxID=2682845 RepID=A0ABW9TZT7_9BACL|nr:MULTISPECIES: hypothetical protein [Paenibacillus]MBA2937039.1 hypothetical protein [Paenibacillus sp. CGMCC 1.16610]MVQ33362.1 hypothetical protein [Paenibacillus anseongense]
MSKLDYTIKLVYPDWVVDEYRDKRMGFAGKHKNIHSPIGEPGEMVSFLNPDQVILLSYR